MATPQTWKGYQPDFIEGFNILLPSVGNWKNDLALNKETNKPELPYIYFSAYHSKSRKMPLFTASNIFREYWIQAEREGDFAPDERIEKTEQLSKSFYKDLNKKQAENKRKMDKGHMVRREDVQWDIDNNQEKAIEAAEATFFYTNACPQHHAVNGMGGIWYNLESSILVRGRSKEPQKAIVFSGPILAENDPYLILETLEDKIKCPLKFWKVVYYVTPENELRRAAFLMSQKSEAEEDGHIETSMKMLETMEATKKPFLEFDDKEKYQVNVSVIEKLTGLGFHKAKEALTEGQHAKLAMKVNENFKSLTEESLVEGLVL